VNPIVIGFCIFSTLGLILLECVIGLGFWIRAKISATA